MWQNLIKIALIGTDKSTPSVSTLDTLKEMGIKTEDVSEAVLEGAGMLSLMRKGGYPLESFKGKLPDTCEKETETYISTQAARYLKEILSGKHEAALGEFAFYAQQHKKIISPEFLPQLLNFSRNDKEVWAIVHPIIGKRGEWLLEQNNQWAALKKQVTTEIPTGFGQMTSEETFKRAREIVTLLNNNRFIGSSDKKITSELKIFAYLAPISLIENLNYLFSSELIQSGDSLILDVYKIFFFRKEMINALNN
jgi:Family of unknown function (DUF5691)